MLECIVFDCDGVILESVDVKTEAFARVCDALAPELTASFVEYVALHGGVSRFEKFAWLIRKAFGRDITQDESRRMGEDFSRFCRDAVRGAPLVPGFMETATAWHGKVPMYVASGTPHYELVDILEERNLARFFTGIYGSPPAKAALLRAIVQEANVTAAHTVMVGDSKTDYDAALIAGTLFYGRGGYFKNGSAPWGEDLSGLNGYLAAL